ncbi:MAG: TonB-dependent receptor, partial [Chitinophagaceae bacterium]|nr:TonB-dependent receptor [Chitinophagaceae bacterium]
PANDSIIWETTTAYNLGLDLGVLDGRVNFHVDAYYKRTNDLLQYITTPPSSSFQRQLRNSGSVENKGIELALDARIVSNKQFEWKANANIAFNRNKILALGSNLTEQYAGNISTGDAPFIQRVG